MLPTELLAGSPGWRLQDAVIQSRFEQGRRRSRIPWVHCRRASPPWLPAAPSARTSPAATSLCTARLTRAGAWGERRVSAGEEHWWRGSSGGRPEHASPAAPPRATSLPLPSTSRPTCPSGPPARFSDNGVGQIYPAKSCYLKTQALQPGQVTSSLPAAAQPLFLGWMSCSSSPPSTPCVNCRKSPLPPRAGAEVLCPGQRGAVAVRLHPHLKPRESPRCCGWPAADGRSPLPLARHSLGDEAPHSLATPVLMFRPCLPSDGPSLPPLLTCTAPSLLPILRLRLYHGLPACLCRLCRHAPPPPPPTPPTPHQRTWRCTALCQALLPACL